MKKFFIIIFATLLTGMIEAGAVELMGTVAVNGEAVPAAYTKLSDNTVSLGSGRNACIPQYTNGFLTVPGEVTIGGVKYTVVEINDMAFRLCNSLTGVSIKENIKRIGKFAFVGCDKLADITLPASLESIGSGAFINTVTRQSSSTVTCLGTTPPKWEYNDVFAFHEDGIGQSVPIILASTVELCVPEGSEETYRNALYSDTNLGWTCPEGWGSFSTLYAGVKVVHVTDPRDLEIVRQIVNNGGKYNFYSAIYLDADLDMAGYKWDWGIGDQEEHPFTGNFYGNGHTIKNLSVINKNATTGEYQGPAGLFSFFGGNIVSNVIFEGCHFEGKTAVGAFAGISGRCSYNTIWVQECTFSVHDGHIGGILGECITTGGANLNQCVVASPNFSESMSTPDEQESVHGCIVGYCYGAYINNCAVWGNTRIVYNKTTSREQWTCNPFVGECNNIDIVQIKNSYNADFRYENYTPASNIEYTNVVLEKHTPISIKTFPDDIVVNTTISGQLFYSLFMIPTLGLDNWVFQQGYFPMPVSFESRMPILVNRAEYRPASLTTPRLNGLSFANATSWSCFYDLSETGYRSMTYRANRLWIDDTFPYNLKQSPSGEPSYYLPLGSATIKVSDGVKYDRTLEVTENGTNPFTATKVKTDENGAPILDEYGNYIPDGEITLFEQTAYTPTGYVVYLPYRLNNNKTFRLFEPSDVTINGGEAFLDMAEIDDEIINPWTPYYLVVNDASINLGIDDEVIINPRPENEYIPFGSNDECRFYGTTNPQIAEQMQGRFVLDKLDEFVPATEALPAWRAYFTMPEGVNKVKVTRELKFWDEGDNDVLVEDFDGTVVNATLQNRTFYKDDTWYTLCLPFDVESFYKTPLWGAKVSRLESSSIDDSDGTLTLNFKPASSIEAGKPYLIKWSDGEDNENPTFYGVRINADAYEVVKAGRVSMFGTYSPLYVPESANILYLGDNNRLYVAEDNMTINSFRACFLYNPINADEPRPIKLNFMPEPVVTGVEEVATTVHFNNDKNWYSIDGRVFNDKPSKPGIYIHNGKKIIIK